MNEETEILSSTYSGITSKISDFIHSLVISNTQLISDTHSRTRIRFRPSVFEKIVPIIFKSFNKRLLIYEFYNYNNKLELKLYLGSAEKNIRVEFFNYLSDNKELFSQTSRALSDVWHSVYKKEFLNKKNFEEKQQEELLKLVKIKWKEFMEEDLIKINDYIKKFDIHYEFHQ